MRIPLIAVPPFFKPAYVSYDIGGHTSLPALIEKRFLGGQHLTRREQYANSLQDTFDFDNSPSLNASATVRHGERLHAAAVGGQETKHEQAQSRHKAVSTILPT